METNRTPAVFWIWIGSAFAVGLVFGIVLGVAGLIDLTKALAQLAFRDSSPFTTHSQLR